MLPVAKSIARNTHHETARGFTAAPNGVTGLIAWITTEWRCMQCLFSFFGEQKVVLIDCATGFKVHETSSLESSCQCHQDKEFCPALRQWSCLLLLVMCWVWTSSASAMIWRKSATRHRGQDRSVGPGDREAPVGHCENDQLLIQGMVASTFAQFESEVTGWVKSLSNINEGDIQRTWFYLEPLFMHSDEVKRELPVLVSSPLALILLRDSHSRKTETTKDLANAFAKLDSPVQICLWQYCSWDASRIRI